MTCIHHHNYYVPLALHFLNVRIKQKACITIRQINSEVTCKCQLDSTHVSEYLNDLLVLIGPLLHFSFSIDVEKSPPSLAQLSRHTDVWDAKVDLRHGSLSNQSLFTPFERVAW